MCFNAACLIGLRPLLHQFKQLLKRYNTLRDQPKQASNENASTETLTSHQLVSMPHRAYQAGNLKAPKGIVLFENGFETSDLGHFDLGASLEHEMGPGNQIRVERHFEFSSA